MKTLLLIAALLVSFAAVSHAQCPTAISVFEEWETYCDAGVPRVRLTLHLSFIGMATLPTDFETDIGAIDSNDVGGIFVTSEFDRIETIAPGQFDFIEEWWPATHFPSGSAKREGVISWACVGGSGVSSIPLSFAAGSFPIAPGEPCAPNPVATSTWGAVKALYH